VESQPQRCGRPFLKSRLADPATRRRVEAAERLGISLKRLDGWEPQTVTVYEYDDQERLVRSVTTTETEWDDQQRGWMLPWRSGGTPAAVAAAETSRETTNPDHDGTPGNWGYQPLKPIRCHRCTALARSEAKYRDNEHPHALMHVVELRPPRRRKPS
jgi:hypothetical protein